MRGARWLVPLILVLPLAAPEPAREIVTGRAYPLDDATPSALPSAAAPASSAEADGITYLGSRLLPRDEPPPPPPPLAGWSWGPAHYDVPLEGSSLDQPRPPAPPGDKTETPPAVPEPAPAPAPPAEEDPSASPPAPEPTPEPAPSPSPPDETSPDEGEGDACDLLCLLLDLL